MNSQTEQPTRPSPILQYFTYEHLPEKLQSVSKPIGDLARQMDASLPDGAEKSAGLRKLLEAKDCLVRAALGCLLLALSLCVPGCNQKPATAAVPFAITSTESAESSNAGDGDALLKAAAIKIVTPSSLASGVNTPYGILTCAHCVNGVTFPIRVTCGDETADAYLRAVNISSDLALLSVKWSKDHPELEVSREDLSLQQVVRSVGRGVDGTLTIENHSIVRLTPREFYATNPFPHGRSGAAVVSSSGAIVGIATGGLVSVEPYQAICVDNGTILGFLSGNNTAAGSVGVAKKKFRAIMWGPSWCTVCINNDWLLESGDERVAYEHKHGVKANGDELAFPKEVQAYANGTFPAGSALAGQQRGYPVWQIELEDGSWGFAHHARSFDDLVAIHRLKSGQPIPVSTFWKALAARQGQRQMDGLSQVAPLIR